MILSSEIDLDHEVCYCLWVLDERLVSSNFSDCSNWVLISGDIVVKYSDILLSDILTGVNDRHKLLRASL